MNFLEPEDQYQKSVTSFMYSINFIKSLNIYNHESEPNKLKIPNTLTNY